MKKIVSFLMALIFILPMSQVGLAYNGDSLDSSNTLKKLIEYVDRNIEINENQLFIKNENKILDYISYNIKSLENALGISKSNDSINNIYNYILKMMDQFNKNVSSGLYKINQDKSITKKNNFQSRFIGPPAYYYINYWWGTRHVYLTDGESRKKAYDLRMSAHGLVATSVIAAKLLPAASFIPTLSSVYLYSLADCIDYNTNLPGNGIILDINYFLIYSCHPR